MRVNPASFEPCQIRAPSSDGRPTPTRPSFVNPHRSIQSFHGTSSSGSWIADGQVPDGRGACTCADGACETTLGYPEPVTYPPPRESYPYSRAVAVDDADGLPTTMAIGDAAVNQRLAQAADDGARMSTTFSGQTVMVAFVGVGDAWPPPSDALAHWPPTMIVHQRPLGAAVAAEVKTADVADPGTFVVRGPISAWFALDGVGWPSLDGAVVVVAAAVDDTQSDLVAAAHGSKNNPTTKSLDDLGRRCQSKNVEIADVVVADVVVA